MNITNTNSTTTRTILVPYPEFLNQYNTDRAQI